MKSMTGYRSMIILVLALVITVITPLQAAAAPRNEYVGDLYLAYGNDADEAKQLQYLDNIYGGISGAVLGAFIANMRRKKKESGTETA